MSELWYHSKDVQDYRKIVTEVTFSLILDDINFNSLISKSSGQFPYLHVLIQTGLQSTHPYPTIVATAWKPGPA
jgi:hypothetical protein